MHGHAIRKQNDPQPTTFHFHHLYPTAYPTICLSDLMLRLKHGAFDPFLAYPDTVGALSGGEEILRVTHGPSRRQLRQIRHPVHRPMQAGEQP